METTAGMVSLPALVSPKAAAVRLGVSVRTLYRIVADGNLRLIHIRGCSRIEETELQGYVENQRRKAL